MPNTFNDRLQADLKDAETRVRVLEKHLASVYDSLDSAWQVHQVVFSLAAVFVIGCILGHVL